MGRAERGGGRRGRAAPRAGVATELAEASESCDRIPLAAPSSFKMFGEHVVVCRRVLRCTRIHRGCGMKLLGRVVECIDEETRKVRIGEDRTIRLHGTQLEPRPGNFQVGTRVVINCTPDGTVLFAWIPTERLGKVIHVFPRHVEIAISSGEGPETATLARSQIFGSLEENPEVVVYCASDRRPYFAEKLS